jgi:Protein of unknown function (DUF3467)
MPDAQQNNKKPAGAAAPEQPTVPQVNWDQTQMRTEYANVVNVFSTREEFSILFGMNNTWRDPATKTFDVKLSNRIVLTPFAAKRLSKLLTDCVAEFERRSGPLDIAP